MRKLLQRLFRNAVHHGGALDDVPGMFLKTVPGRTKHVLQMHHSELARVLDTHGVASVAPNAADILNRFADDEMLAEADRMVDMMVDLEGQRSGFGTPAEEDNNGAAELPAEEDNDEAAELPAEEDNDEAAELPTVEGNNEVELPAEEAAELPTVEGNNEVELPAEEDTELPAVEGSQQTAVTHPPGRKNAHKPARNPSPPGGRGHKKKNRGRK
jgi:hypothetical protein